MRPICCPADWVMRHWLVCHPGLYACLFSGLFFWLFCSSKHTSITVTSAISILVGSSLGTLADGDAGRFAALAACAALMVAALAFLAWLVRAGVIVNFVSETVLPGFKRGVALFIGSTQLPKLFGFKGGHGNFWERTGDFVTHLDQTNIAALAMGTIELAALVLGKLFLRDKPVALLVVVGGMGPIIWAHLLRSCRGDGHRAGRHRAAIAVAERLCRTHHRLDPSRMSRSRHHPR